MSNKNKPQPINRGTVTHVSAWEGPLPPPASLEEFKRVDPNLPLKIMEMAEKEQAHRHALDLEMYEADRRQYDLASQANAVADNSNKREFWDKIASKMFALGIVIAVVGSTIFLVIKTTDWKAWLALGVELLAFATVVIKSNPKTK